MSHSVSIQAQTETAITHNASTPNIHIATARAGIRAIMTFHMLRDMLLCECR